MYELVTDLRPCPFCGSQKAELVDLFDNEGNPGVAYCCRLRYSDCSMCGPVRNDEPSARKAWNQRRNKPIEP